MQGGTSGPTLAPLAAGDLLILMMSVFGLLRMFELSGTYLLKQIETLSRKNKKSEMTDGVTEHCFELNNLLKITGVLKCVS